MFIRQAIEADAAAIHAVHTAAFRDQNPAGTAEIPEARLVGELRADGDLIPALSLVAERDGEVIGHACSSAARVAEDTGAAVGFGPLGVLPELQRSGAGSALVHATLGAANALGFAAVVLLGDPKYYSRFGFVLASTLGITPPVPDWAPHFQARALTAYTPSIHGPFRYSPAFERL
ncbi:GNAT family N-acetyltransferase [Amycolatopsis saalfeldensis]|uniref:Putative acetyltransferase n=1 Tax=Amycolatopsis saalfeldensis TaxID=394193 RepID=A0A1H8QY49_9PSEU|nr:N-acetyltransferase [Amycolatopsis saalfeldensis]SEO59105.1 putative acetyltransferase [Amycolatopsis saalfeldensis]